MATTTPLAIVNVTAKLRARLTVTETADTGATGPGVSVLRHIWEIPETIYPPGTGASERKHERQKGDGGRARRLFDPRVRGHGLSSDR